MGLLSDLKKGDKAVARKIDRYGRFKFMDVEVVQVIGNNLRVKPNINFNRKDGCQTGWIHTRDEESDLGPWMLFTADDAFIAKQRAEQAAGKLGPAVPRDRVKLIRAFHRLREAGYDELESHRRGNVAEKIIEWFGQESDYVPPKCKFGFTPNPGCGNCLGDGFSVDPSPEQDGEACVFCMEDAIKRGEIDGTIEGVKYESGQPAKGAP